VVKLLQGVQGILGYHALAAEELEAKLKVKALCKAGTIEKKVRGCLWSVICLHVVLLLDLSFISYMIRTHRL